MKYKVDKHIEQSRGLRSFDDVKLNTPIAQLCRLNVKPNDSEADRARWLERASVANSIADVIDDES